MRTMTEEDDVVGRGDDGLAYVLNDHGHRDRVRVVRAFWETTFFFRPTSRTTQRRCRPRVATSGTKYFLCDITDASSSGASRAREDRTTRSLFSRHREGREEREKISYAH